MRIRWAGVLVSLLCATVAWGGESADDDKAWQEARDVVKQIQARYEKTKDLQADFVQTTKIEGFERPVTSSGRVYIKKPGRLDFALICSDRPAAVAAVFTTNRFPAAPVQWSRQVLAGRHALTALDGRGRWAR